MKMHWFSIFVLVLLGLYACDKQDDLLGDHQVTNQPTATRVSSQLRSFGNCSYLGDGEPISGIWNHCREWCNCQLEFSSKLVGCGGLVSVPPFFYLLI